MDLQAGLSVLEATAGWNLPYDTDSFSVTSIRKLFTKCRAVVTHPNAQYPATQFLSRLAETQQRMKQQIPSQLEKLSHYLDQVDFVPRRLGSSLPSLTDENRLGEVDRERMKERVRGGSVKDCLLVLQALNLKANASEEGKAWTRMKSGPDRIEKAIHAIKVQIKKAEGTAKATPEWWQSMENIISKKEEELQMFDGNKFQETRDIFLGTQAYQAYAGAEKILDWIEERFKVRSVMENSRRALGHCPDTGLAFER